MDIEDSIVAVLIEKGVKVETIIEKCHRVDKNRDGIIHVNDFTKALNQLLGIYTLTRQQMRYIISNIVCEDNHDLVEFERLDMVIDTRNHVELQAEENWYSDELDNTQYMRRSGTVVSERSPQRRHMKGSLGQWIHGVACPSEIE
jgi:hypothetical protein